MAKVRVRIDFAPDIERDIQCNCPELCVGCGTDTGLESFNSKVYNKKLPLTLSGPTEYTRAHGNYRLCRSCKERVVNDYTSTTKAWRYVRLLLLLSGLIMIPVAFYWMTLEFPRFPNLLPRRFPAFMTYWGVWAAVIIFVLGLAGSFNYSRKEMLNRLDGFPFRGYARVTRNGTMILSNESYANEFQRMNPDLKVKLKSGVQRPSIVPDGAVFFMMFVVAFIFIIIAVLFQFV
ncbi:MAG: hypothetical protein ACFFE2_07030 [Candidatus Thorarchaeota archaeon]